MNAVSMIDDLLGFDNESDDLDARLAALSRQSSYGLQRDSERGTSVMGTDEEIRNIRERAEFEKEQSLKQFQELV